MRVLEKQIDNVGHFQNVERDAGNCRQLIDDRYHTTNDRYHKNPRGSRKIWQAKHSRT